jgi:hypothetical protein
MDAFMKPLFGKSEQGIVFYPMGNKTRPHPVNPLQVEQLRTATAVTLVIVGVMAIGGISYAAGVTLLILMTPDGIDAFAFDPRLLYLGDVLQLAFIALVILIYRAVVEGILKRP